MSTVDSASDDRTANNSVRHKYRVLTDAEKAQVASVGSSTAMWTSAAGPPHRPISTVFGQTLGVVCPAPTPQTCHSHW